MGNRLSSLNWTGWQYNSSNQLTSQPQAAYTYDYNGNTTSKTDANGATSSAWDYENRLTSVTLPGTGGVVTFKYDPFGRRIQKSSAAGTVNYAYEGANIVAEINPLGNVLAAYAQSAYIDEPLAVWRAGVATYYQADRLGSITSVSNAAGALATTYSYDAFGNVVTASGSVINPFRFTGRELDSETSLYYYRARYYDPSSGRFISEDPIGFLGGDTNLYRYVWNSTSNLTDPSGRVGIGAIVGTGAGWGVPGTGGAGSASFQAGSFIGNGMNGGAAVSVGGFAPSPSTDQTISIVPPNTRPWMLGAWLTGIGWGLYGTNGDNVDDLSGPFHTVEVNAPVSLSVEWGRNCKGRMIVQISIMLGKSWGLGIANYTTTTKPILKQQGW
jgi:RHS repeat-associated protein